jgi:hypothetical protein
LNAYKNEADAAALPITLRQNLKTRDLADSQLQNSFTNNNILYIKVKMKSITQEEDAEQSQTDQLYSNVEGSGYHDQSPN